MWSRRNDRRHIQHVAQCPVIVGVQKWRLLIMPVMTVILAGGDTRINEEGRGSRHPGEAGVRLTLQSVSQGTGRLYPPSLVSSLNTDE